MTSLMFYEQSGCFLIVQKGVYNKILINGFQNIHKTQDNNILRLWLGG